MGTVALEEPAARNTLAVGGIRPGNALELPGTAVSTVIFGANSLSLTTDTGSYAFTNVGFAAPITGFTAAPDPATGLLAITFTGPDVFEENVKATNGALAGNYLWSDPTN